MSHPGDSLVGLTESLQEHWDQVVALFSCESEDAAPDPGISFSPQLTDFWMSHQNFHSFLLLAYAKFSSDPRAVLKYPVDAVDDPDLDVGVYCLSSIGLSLYDYGSKKWITVLTFETEDLQCASFIQASNRFFSLASKTPS